MIKRLSINLIWILSLVFSLGTGKGAQVGSEPNAVANDTGDRPSSQQPQRTSKYLSQRLWQSRIQAPDGPKAEDNEDLSPLINQLRSVKIQKPQKTTEAPADANGIQSDPNGVVALPTTAPATPLLDNTLKPKTGRLSDDTLVKIRSLKPEQIEGPVALQLAELLYQSEYSTLATPFYRQAADRLDPNIPLARNDRAWALFQLGNCLRDSDPAEAKLVYQQLNAEYPETPWSAMAAMWHDLADWYWREEPLQTLEQVSTASPAFSTDPNSLNGDF